MCELSDEVVHDYMLLGEVSDTISMLKEKRRAMSVRALARENVVMACKDAYPAARKAACASKAKKSELAKKAKDMAERKKRFFDGLREAPKATLYQEMPPCASVIEDASNGRFQFTYPGCPRRSFSWTLRGEREESVALSNRCGSGIASALAPRCQSTSGSEASPETLPSCTPRLVYHATVASGFVGRVGVRGLFRSHMWQRRSLADGASPNRGASEPEVRGRC